MSITGSIVRRRLLLSAAAAAIAAAAAASPATASPAVFPVGGGDQVGFGHARNSVLVAARSAFEVLPDRDAIPVDQIMRNMDSGFMW